MCTIIVWSVTTVSLCVTVSPGTVPSSDALKGLPLFEAGEEVTVWAARQASSLVTLQSMQAELGAAMKPQKCC